MNSQNNKENSIPVVVRQPSELHLWQLRQLVDRQSEHIRLIVRCIIRALVLIPLS